MPWLSLLMIIDCNTLSCSTSMVVMVMLAAVDDRPGRWVGSMSREWLALVEMEDENENFL